MVAIPLLPSCEWEGFANTLIPAANAAATEVVTAAIAAADMLTTTASQPLHNNKTASLLYSHLRRMEKKDRNELCGGRGEMALLLQTSNNGTINTSVGGGSWDVLVSSGKILDGSNPQGKSLCKFLYLAYEVQVFLRIVNLLAC